MLQNSRIVFSDNGVLADISVAMNDYVSGSKVLPIVAAEDFIFVGADFPFNHKFIDVGVGNDQASSISVDLWDGDSWRSAIDVIDQTSSAGNCFASSGHLSFYPDPDYGWVRDDTNRDGEQITGLSGVKIYGLYWARLSFSGDLSPLTAIKYIGHKFSADDDLFALYPEFRSAQVKNTFQTGKTTWDEQAFAAAEHIIMDLKAKNLIFSPSQILSWESFKKASVHKTAAIIWAGFGKDYFENADRAEREYKSAITLSLYDVDKTNDARLDVTERVSRSGWLSR